MEETEARREADHFVRCETEFHLGSLPTEQAHPRTRGLAEATAGDTREGIRMLLGVDRDVTEAARRVFLSGEFDLLTRAFGEALGGGGRVWFSGCGATGRLSILLESAWRAFWRGEAGSGAGADAVASIMTGGDYALVSSVESFEDHATFGARQVDEAGVGAGDVFVAITEGGETSSVIGSAWRALERGARVFFACNNPPEILAGLVERSRRVILDDRIVKLDLSSGPMAVAGSTRMQATTMELLVIGVALESALATRLGGGDPVPGCAGRFAALLEDLSGGGAVDAMARWVEMEEATYRGGGAVTYFGESYLLDIFTDTTERAPTFSLPPFRKSDDARSPRSLAFVKNPLHPTPETWRRMLGREPRCLDWDADVYRQLGAIERIRLHPPRLDRGELYKFLVGAEDDPSRYGGARDRAALVMVGDEAGAGGGRLRLAYAGAAARFPSRAILAVGPVAGEWGGGLGELSHAPCEFGRTRLRLWEHLAIKLVLNTVSTAVAARLGRLVSNWMAHVETTNKKLIDRGTRLVAELAGLDYAEACYELHRSRAQIAREIARGGDRRSPVAVTLERLRGAGREPGAGR